jgi:hypothetical protein
LYPETIPLRDKNYRKFVSRQFAIRTAVLMAWPGNYYFRPLAFTEAYAGPPPFSSMNSMPASSNARLSTAKAA